MREKSQSRARRPVRRVRTGVQGLNVVLLAAGALAGAALAAAPPALGAACARTAAGGDPASPGAGTPCWVDVSPYPFGLDGNAVDPGTDVKKCTGSPTNPYGPNWNGDFIDQEAPSGPGPCYLRVTSMAFRAANRGLAATEAAGSSSNASSWEPLNPYGVWIYNGNRWFPDPTFPGPTSCPGSRILWAGKLDYWLVGRGESDPNGTTSQTLCRFDGVNVQWEILKLPAATLERLPAVARANGTFTRAGGIDAGACYSWDNCWFFGTNGIVVHWEGNALFDASPSPDRPWQDGTYRAAVARVDDLGNPFGLAVATTARDEVGTNATPPAPDGSPPAQLFSSAGGPFAAAAFSPPTTAAGNDPYRTDLVAVDADSHGAAWVAGVPTTRGAQTGGPSPLLRLDGAGAPASCSGYDAATFRSGERWRALSVTAGDDGAIAGGALGEPLLARVACGRAPALTRFRIPDPRDPSQSSAQPLPADPGGSVQAVAAPAGNDLLAATSDGPLTEQQGTEQRVVYLRPHLYVYTDGQPPAATPGDDHELRPSLFVADPPVYVQPPPVIIQPSVVTTSTRAGRTTRRRLKAAVYGLRTRVVRRASRLSLVIAFRLRYSVSLGAVGLRGRRVVTRAPVRRFTGRAGQLVLPLDPKRYPTRVAFVSPPTKRSAP